MAREYVVLAALLLAGFVSAQMLLGMKSATRQLLAGTTSVPA
jgi:hypothetical protein